MHTSRAGTGEGKNDRPTTQTSKNQHPPIDTEQPGTGNNDRQRQPTVGTRQLTPDNQQQLSTIEREMGKYGELGICKASEKIKDFPGIFGKIRKNGNLWELLEIAGVCEY
jgi:hypothetical protein